MSVAPVAPRPIPLWRLVAGAFLHFGVLAFVVIVPLAVLLLGPAGASAETLVWLAVRCSAIFVAALVASGLAATLLAALIDWTRRPPGAPTSAAADVSRHHLATAVDSARRRLDPVAAGQVAAIAGGDWDHDDHRLQALARDLNQVVATAAIAIGSAAADRRPLILQDTAEAVSHIAEEFRALKDERVQAEEAAARTTALYVRNRYGPGDSSLRRD